MSARPRFAVGIDLGQQSDPSAFAVCELRQEISLGGDAKLPHVEVNHLERLPLGTAYPEVIARVHALARTLHFVDSLIVLDCGGVGRAVVDQLRHEGLRCIAVTTTGGQAATRTKRSRLGADWNVSKLRLLAGVAELVYSGRLRVAHALQEARQLLQELGDLESRVSAAGRESIQVSEAATGHHGDLVSAVALASWALLDRPNPKVRILDWRQANRLRG